MLRNVRGADTGKAAGVSTGSADTHKKTAADVSSGKVMVNDNFHVDNAESMYSMFYKCEKLTEPDVSNFDPDMVADMGL